MSEETNLEVPVTELITEPTIVAETVPEPTQEIITEPVVEPQPPAVVEPEEQTLVYQPTDESGRPLGGKQVIKYRTEEEKTQKLIEQNTLLIRKLRAETRKTRLGIVDEEVIPPEAPRIEEPLDFTAPQLTPDQKVRLARDLGIDPERLDETTSALFESTLGVKPDVLRETLRKIQEETLNAKARIESEAFVRDNPEYVRCPENFKAISAWMVRYGLAPVRENFQRAYDTLRTAGVLVEGAETGPEPVVATPPPPPSPPAPAPEPVEPPSTEPPSPPAPARIPTGLTRSSSTDSAPPRSLADDIVYEYQPKDAKGVPNGPKRTFKGLAAINAMPADEYKHRVLNEPGFREKEQRLEREAAQKRQR